MTKVTYLDDLQQMQADHIWGKVRLMRKQKVAKEPSRVFQSSSRHHIKDGKVWMRGFGFSRKVQPYTEYRSKVAVKVIGRAGKVAQKLIELGDY